MPYFDSRDPSCRAPFGAVAAGVAVHFRICLPRWLGCSAARLEMACDDALDTAYNMFWCGMAEGGAEYWECHFAPEAPGLYFYHFSLDTWQGRRYLCKTGAGSEASLTEEPVGDYQLTCYAAGFATPDWLAGGIMYQIFPDRFAWSGERKDNVPADRELRTDWGGQPDWRPDALGKIRNNDYFMGDLKGIENRLDRLAALGVTCIYLNPIFEAHSNHRYNTADYGKIDPLLGTENDFRSLCKTAASLGIRILLDGVFSHTGSDSKYFNREHRYPPEGACDSLSSPYAGWFRFSHWPNAYTGWWGFDSLPEVDKANGSYLDYINGENGIVRRWLKAGAAGWRLDVADELPDGFIGGLRQAAKSEKPDAVVLGEVWEDASNKRSYGHRRKYLLGDELDTVMNYPFRDAILAFLTEGGGDRFFDAILTIAEDYPPQVLRLLMNHIGTHDTERALTALAGEPAGGRGRSWQAAQKLSDEQRRHGLRLLRLASALQYWLPGVPCVYYGDEAGAKGYRDPFCRGCYPWGSEDTDLLLWYRKLGQMRRQSPCLKEGGIRRLHAPEGVAAFERADGDSRLLCAVNREPEPKTVPLPEHWHNRTINLGGGEIRGGELLLPGIGCAIGMM